MSENANNVRPFRVVPKGPRTSNPLTVPVGDKLGLYPLGNDVLVSLPLFQVVIDTLAHGSTEERTALALQLRDAYAAPYA